MEENTNSLDKAAQEYVQSWTEAVTQMWGSWMNLMGLAEVPDQTQVQPRSTDSPTIATDKNESQQSHNLVSNLPDREVPTTKNLQAFPQHLKDKDSIIRELKEQLAIQDEKAEQQAKTIAKLEQQLAELQTVASIGSRQLNKWRSRIF